MAILQVQDNNNPYQFFSGLATKQQGATLPDVTGPEENDICACDLQCAYTEPVFAKVGSDWWKNDKSSFLFQKLVAADTITIKLYKDGAELATITDNTYGEYYSTFTNYPLYVGFVIYWENVFNTNGAGLYQVKAEKTIIGASSTFESQYFRLLEYTDELADETIRVETYNTGNIESSQFNYTDLLAGGWYQSYRLRGRLFAPDPKKETDNYKNQDWELTQIQDKIINEYTLETEQLPALIAKQFVYDNLLANQFLVTDYNIHNFEIYRRLDLYPIEVEKSNEPTENTQRSYKVKLKDKKENIIKRNY